MNKKILVPLAKGFETIEALTVVDVFRRAGITVDMAALGDDLQVLSSHNILVTADMLLSDCAGNTYDAIILPGGLEGSENLRDSAQVVDMLKKQNQDNKLYGAICAAPALVLEHHGLLEDKKATCFPAMLGQLPEDKRQDEPVVVSKNCVTGRGAGHSVSFALALLEELAGPMIRQQLEEQLALK
ncbi:MAG: DJ-1 family protein [Deltaproteobacteria bacterium]|nr:MAG: DJ-1 family protein [Deltaproteobacteria bacterium]